ncbi:hypothetical protein IWQ62_006231 [Dispira parvispora]|uniref:ribonuclease H n=1 Tax=Dispira parvispora TaxID=1520584 RepID=A0A9W8ANF1_9FUNG|nr:hypothetical protein IWQ62_006231 [Dispira parvispora]
MNFKYYSVRVGRHPEVYLHPDACRVQVNGYPGADSKVFTNLEYARDYIYSQYLFPEHIALPKEDSNHSDSDSQGSEWSTEFIENPDLCSGSDSESHASNTNLKSNASASHYTIGMTRLIGVLEDIDALCRIPISTGRFIPPLEEKSVYIKGVAIKDKQGETRAGVGVYFGNDDCRNLGFEMETLPRTHHRAELMAYKWAILSVGIDTPLKIYTTSAYVRDCLEKWHHRWLITGWVTTRGRPVANADLIKEILELQRLRSECKTELCYVPRENGGWSAVSAGELARNAILDPWLFGDLEKSTVCKT